MRGVGFLCGRREHFFTTSQSKRAGYAQGRGGWRCGERSASFEREETRDSSFGAEAVLEGHIGGRATGEPAAGVYDLVAGDYEAAGRRESE